jgi:hypothetical protein
MRRLTLAFLALAVLAGPSLAQDRMRSRPPAAMTEQEQQRQREAADIERQYKATIKATPGKAAANNDPWAIVRGMDGKSGQK